jgi:ribosomal protein L22
MYQIQPYDLSESFKFIPEKKKYSLLFYKGNSVDFTSKREAYSFIAQLSILFVEQLAICEMVNNTINSFSFHIRPNSKSNADKFNVYHSNYQRILEIIRDLKFYQTEKIQLYQVVMEFDQLINYIIENCKILNAKNKNCVVPYLVIIEKSAKTLWKVIENAENNYRNSQLSLFIN